MSMLLGYAGNTHGNLCATHPHGLEEEWPQSRWRVSARSTRVVPARSTDVNLEINDGEFVVLVGPSGCGKSTLLRMIAGLEEITEGAISIGDQVVNDVPPKDRNIAMVFQNYALYPHMSVFDNMAFGLKLRKMPKDEINRLVRRSGQSARDHRVSRPQAQGPFRWSASARRHGSGHRAGTGCLPDGRAALQPRRQAACSDAVRARRPPRPPQDDDRLRHPRSGRGHDHGRSGGRDAQGDPPASRYPARAVRPSLEPVRSRLHRVSFDELHLRRSRRREGTSSGSISTEKPWWFRTRS